MPNGTGQGRARIASAAAIAAVCAALAAPAPVRAQDASGGVTDSAPGQPTVSYQDILKNPDDLQLNFQYARQQIDQGNLSAATSALERILITHAGADRVRLLYAIVLYRMGNVGEADAELQAVDRAALPADQQATLDTFRTKVARDQRRVVGSVGVTAGIRHDTNRNGFPEAGEFQVNLPGSGQTTFDSTGQENADVGRFLMLDGRVNVATDLQRVPGVRFEAAALYNDQVEEDDLDLGSGMARVETRYLADWVQIEPRLTYRQITLGDEQYTKRGSGRLRLRRPLGADQRLVLFGDATLGYESFTEVERAPFAEEQDGRYITLGPGFSYTPWNSLTLGAQYSFTDKNADVDFEAFQSHRLEASAQYVVSAGVYLSGRGSVTHREYDAPDTFVSASEVREDEIYQLGAGISVTAKRVAKTVGAKLPDSVVDNLVFNLSGTYRTVNSNFSNFEYDNVRTEFSISKRFPF